jgi:hypothetical protein
MIGVVGCVLCGRRQVDPDSGPSLWRRGVRHGEQVLVCPQCQNDDGTDLLDRCASCGSSALAKRLGVVTCRECGATDDVVGAPKDPAHPPGSGRDALAADVAAALDRVLGTEVAPRIDEP